MASVRTIDDRVMEAVNNSDETEMGVIILLHFDNLQEPLGDHVLHAALITFPDLWESFLRVQLRTHGKLSSFNLEQLRNRLKIERYNHCALEKEIIQRYGADAIITPV